MTTNAMQFDFKVVQNNNTNVRRYFLDGKRVARKEYQQIQSECIHQGEYGTMQVVTNKHLTYYFAVGRCPFMHTILNSD